MSKLAEIGRRVEAPTTPQAPRSAEGVRSYRGAPARVTARRPGGRQAQTERVLALHPNADLQDAVAGMRWFNGLPKAERRRWLDAAGSAVPADAWEAFKRGREGL